MKFFQIEHGLWRAFFYYKAVDNYLSKNSYWDKWMEEQTGVTSNLDIKMELWLVNSISSNRIGPFF